MATRSISLNGMPSAAKIYAGVIRHSLNKTIKGYPALPKLDLHCSNINIDHQHVQCYSEVCGFGSSNGPILAPMTYPFVLTFPLQMHLMSDRSFPHLIVGMVHLTNRIEQFSNIAAGTNVDAKVSLSDTYIYHEKGLCFSMTAELFDSSSKQLLWRNESLMLRRKKVTVPEGESPFQSKIKEPDMAALSEIEKWTLQSNLGRKYALASGDYNPIHLTSMSAKLLGFKNGAIIHGMWTKARAIATVMKDAPSDINALSLKKGSKPAAEVYVEFKTPLFLPGEVALMSGELSGTHSAGISSEGGRKGAIFQVKSTAGEQLPHVRGVCSWNTE